ncbi:RICIN domain-containing protein [Clostridium felsineum]|uniref:Uncharacterized protein n=1 Tax=Clostridium felsineum TaxID=36839 RepID=A0A1S8L1K7_9CLOT|nr:RICIN domain-containing protein [Clostridium felsineum]URZ09217.1 hypothetical protein CLROS_046330 [Clostridium felsineum]URZ13903.1 hypothetical protein CROST_046810 [Clostridium felsineum]
MLKRKLILGLATTILFTQTITMTNFTALASSTSNVNVAGYKSTKSASNPVVASLPTMPPAGYDKGGQYPAGRVQDVYYYSPVTKSTRKMVVYTPPGYNSATKYPVIYAIHGVNSWPSTIFDSWCVGASTLADNLIGEGKIQPVIIVAMDNNNVDSHQELFNAVMPYAESHYPIIADADHRGLYGYSMGGGVTFAEGLGHLDTFHHICPSSATPFNHPSDANMFPNNGAEAKQKLKTLLLSCGTSDWDGFYPPNLATHNYCVAHGIPHYWLSVQGGGHDGSVWRPAMWNFLQLAFPANQSPNNNGGNNTTMGSTVTLKDGWYYIKNVNAQKYLQVADNIGKAGQNVELRTGSKANGQKWYLTNVGDGYVTLKSALGDYMLDISYGENKDGTKIQIYNAYAGDAQRVSIKASSTNGAYAIATKSSDQTKVLDDSNASTADGTNVCQWSYNGNNNQLWTFEAAN